MSIIEIIFKMALNSETLEHAFSASSKQHKHNSCIIMADIAVNHIETWIHSKFDGKIGGWPHPECQIRKLLASYNSSFTFICFFLKQVYTTIIGNLCISSLTRAGHLLLEYAHGMRMAYTAYMACEFTGTKIIF
jgi:hypothetical protein